MLKIHAIRNYKDDRGWQSLCDRYRSTEAHRFTGNRSQVTCKLCRRRMVWGATWTLRGLTLSEMVRAVTEAAR